MSNDLELHIGGSFDAMAKRVSEAWHKAENGEAVAEDHLTFVDWDVFSQTMSTKRLELLRHLHRHPQTSIAALARSLDRDYRRVHEDVDILKRAGLIEQRETGLYTGYDEIHTTIAL